MSAHPTENINVDEDEAVADIWDLASTFSISSSTSVLDYPIEHGRQYHAYKSGSYHRPNDEEELDRLDLMNALLQMVNNDKLHLAPIEPASQRILDIGAGTGIWCIAMGDQYPSAEIIGVDISASAPPLLPPNVRFEIDDVEDPWTYGNPFDYIHSRYMAGSIKDWPRLMEQCYVHLKPGGWVEFQDFDIDYYSQDGSLTPDHALRRWLTTAYGAEKQTGRTLCPGKYLERWVHEAGFTNVQVVKSPLPLGVWPKDQKLKKIGLLNWTQLWEGLQGMSLRLYIDFLGWSREDLEILLTEVRKDLKDSAVHAMFDLLVTLRSDG
ncbi:uncharacterized protein Z518_10818 [Rhinocladiella mackenziei CBS 650.93]|uniref:S-adenosyl-L-methionine-dependent methyltransferase n=1 Tax=Rhinocladiella mackenziei CBS 650.93 TaxID=1442369 RepID=A0A0D2I9F1_9EURO|nr:uncharacterized protein Z518_10818 [Rhinocladiella mackenziei CBS 650.93]KIW99890.1 hypothetical protein Z518_10818 [Rhinocladiella mackenziei CBS 650.93]